MSSVRAVVTPSLGRIGAAARGWYDAVVGAAHNPLLQAWWLADRRSRRGVPLLAGLLAAVPGLLIAYVMLSGAWAPTDVLDFPLLIALLAAFPVALSWLLLRVYAAGQFALTYLSREKRAAFRRRIDDMVLISGLSEQEMLVAGLLHGLRLLLPPVLLLNALLVVGFGAWIHYTSHEASLSGTFHFDRLGLSGDRFQLYLLQAPWLYAKLCLSSMLAATVTLLALIALGMTPRSGVLPAIGAAALSFGQLVQIALAGWLSQHWIGIFDYGWNSWDQPAAAAAHRLELLRGAWQGAAMFTLLVFLALLLARRYGWGGLALAACVPLALAGITSVLTNAIYGSPLLRPEDVMLPELAWSATSLALLNPLHLAPAYWLEEGSYFYFGAPTDYPFIQPWRLPLLLTLQLALALICAEFARDALARRKWGSLSDVYRG